MINQKAIIMDIAMNLNRIGNWAADGFTPRSKKINMFLDQTSKNLESLDDSNSNLVLNGTLQKFKLEYKKLALEARSKPPDEMLWAEKMMTWGNILTHRAKLL